jgi:hypothetical protein
VCERKVREQGVREHGSRGRRAGHARLSRPADATSPFARLEAWPHAGTAGVVSAGYDYRLIASAGHN